MNFLATKMEVMNSLGKGLSVRSIMERTGITYNQLCQLAEQYPDLLKELNRWYKRYDFTVKDDKSLEVKEKPLKRSKKQVEQMVGE